MGMDIPPGPVPAAGGQSRPGSEWTSQAPDVALLPQITSGPSPMVAPVGTDGPRRALPNPRSTGRRRTYRTGG
jgi:hypothetical protein